LGGVKIEKEGVAVYFILSQTFLETTPMLTIIALDLSKAFDTPS